MLKCCHSRKKYLSKLNEHGLPDALSEEFSFKCLSVMIYEHFIVSILELIMLFWQPILYTCWTALSLTFDLLCRSRLMLDEPKLSPTSASICTTNRMLGEALSNKCFIMPKSLNDNIKIEFALDKYLAAQMTNIFKLITY